MSSSNPGSSAKPSAATNRASRPASLDRAFLSSCRPSSRYDLSSMVIERVTINLREELNRSLQNPHPETSELADAGFEEWTARQPGEKASDLVDLRSGRSVRWVPGRGWLERK